jgi:hypothetical protein
VIFRKALRLAAALLAIWGLTSGVQAQDTNAVNVTMIDVPALQAAADQGDVTAQYDLARCYEKGRGVPQDYAKAVVLMRQAADHGYAPAQGQLGYYYGRGLGVANNPAEALKWYQLSAGQSNAVAQFALGYIYSTGRGVPQDLDQAVQWWQKAAGQNLAEAQNALGQLSMEQSRTNQLKYTEAFRWLHLAAEQDYAGAMNNLGVLYEYGRGTGKDWTEAAKWYRRGAELGNIDAMANLGCMYEDGRGGLTNDLVQAYAWLELSYELGGRKAKPLLMDIANSKVFTTNNQAEADQMVKELKARYNNRKPGANQN